MDIAKYIGLYLLKNNFCYIHGLGNLELKKRPATHDGQALQGPLYEVTCTSTGSIDDSLANFIATHEQTSISKAANSLRDFSIATRTALQEGKEVAIPSLGKFVEQQGLVKFITDPQLQYTPPSIPVLRTAKRLEEQPSFKMQDPSENDYRSRAANIGGTKILMGIVAIAVIGLLIFLATRFLGGDKKPAVETTQTVVPAEHNALTPPVPDNIIPDTTVHNTVPAAQTPVANPANNGPAQVILGTYANRVTAERRVKTLVGNGNTVTLAVKDSTTFYVVMPITFAPADSARVLDSLRKMFNPKGVSIYR